MRVGRLGFQEKTGRQQERKGREDRRTRWAHLPLLPCPWAPAPAAGLALNSSSLTTSYPSCRLSASMALRAASLSSACSRQ